MTDIVNNKNNLALTALLSGAVLIGFSPILVRLSDTSPLASAFFRVFLSLPLLWLAARVYAPTKSATEFSPRLLLPGIFFAGDLALWHMSIEHTLVANATLLANAAPVFVVFGSWLVLKETINRQFLAGLAIVATGVLLLMGQSMKLGVDNVVGDLLGIGTAVFYAGYILSMRYLRAWYPTVTLMWWSSLVTSICLFPLALVGSENFVPGGWQGWAVLLALAWFAHAGGQGLITFALAHLPAAFSSVTLLVQPIFAGLLAWVIFSEQLNAVQLAGMAIALVGIYFCKRAG
ncbi:MAG: DMT family transporter [Gammaproteobacteria bacterium]|nr:DMT family transporter [Gammaproteobacteria bacterium]